MIFLVSNVVSPSAERWFSIIYKGAKIALWEAMSVGGEIAVRVK
jgi:hypothetical protein